VRELANFIERAMILSKGRTLEIPLAELEGRRHRPDHDDRTATLRAVERMHILRILGETNWRARWPAGSRGRAWSEKERPCLVGDYPLADICYAPFVTVLDRVRLGGLVHERPAVRAWIERLLAGVVMSSRTTPT